MAKKTASRKKTKPRKPASDGELNQTVNGKKHGQWVTHFANGNKRAEGAYQHGKKHGPWTQWHKNGNIASKATFHEGDYTGLYQTFHDNGNVQREGMYNPIRGNSADGTKDGEWPSYQLDGKTVWRIITYKRGSRACEDQIFAERDH